MTSSPSVCFYGALTDKDIKEMPICSSCKEMNLEQCSIELITIICPLGRTSAFQSEGHGLKPHLSRSWTVSKEKKITQLHSQFQAKKLPVCYATMKMFFFKLYHWLWPFWTWTAWIYFHHYELNNLPNSHICVKLYWKLSVIKIHKVST